MQDWIVFTGCNAEFSHDRSQVGGAVNFTKRIDNPHNARIKVRTGDIMEQLAQKWIGFRNEIQGFRREKSVGVSSCKRAVNKP